MITENGWLVSLSVSFSFQEKKGQELQKGPEVEKAKLEKLLSLLRDTDSPVQKSSTKTTSAL